MAHSTPWAFNQVSDLADYSLFDSDPLLIRMLQHYGVDPYLPALQQLGGWLGQADTLALGTQANRQPPVLHTHSRTGERIDHIEYAPAWHRLLGSLRGAGLHAVPWEGSHPAAWVERAAGFYLHGQVEAGSLCPITMTFVSVPMLRQAPALFAALGPSLLARDHDPRALPWQQKNSALIGMGLTEKQGGSDLRQTSTQACPSHHDAYGDWYHLSGHK